MVKKKYKQKQKIQPQKQQGLWALYMVCLWPILTLLEEIHGLLSMIGMVRLFAIGCLIFVFMFFIILLMQKITKKSFQIVAIGVSASLIVFFMYAGIIDYINNLIYFMLLFGVGAFFAWFARNDNFATIFSIAITVPIVYLFITVGLNVVPSYLNNISKKIEKSDEASNNIIVSNKTNKAVIKPNVYFIIVDGYPRSDIQKKLFNIDDSHLQISFKETGYTVFENAKANYITTHLALASMLETNYIATKNGELSPIMLQGTITGQNKTVQRFKRFGYKYYHLGGRLYTVSSCSGLEDLCLGKQRPRIEFMDMGLVKKTPLSIWMKEILSLSTRDNSANLEDLKIAIEGLEINKSTEPFFLFAHTIPPHAPYPYNADCTERDDKRSLLEALFTDNKSAYKDAILCVNKQLEELITIINKKDPNALVVIQSDHGTHFTVDWYRPLNKWSKDSLYERFSILSAVKSPEKCQKMLPDDWIAVNSFRFVFACITQTAPIYLKPAFYVTTYMSKNPDYGNIHRYDTIYDGRSNQ